MEVKFHKISEACDLVQLLEWLPDIDEEIEYITKECARINSLPGRKAIAVRYSNRISLFVDDVTGR